MNLQEPAPSPVQPTTPHLGQIRRWFSCGREGNERFVGARDGRAGEIEIQEVGPDGILSRAWVPWVYMLFLIFTVLLAAGLLTGTKPELLVVASGGALLAAVILTLLRRAERARSRRKTVPPLLPGARRAFIPCEEGVYTRERNAFARAGRYRLGPWGSLDLGALDSKRHRSAVRDGKTMIYLRARPGAGGGALDYDDLKRVVLEHLPADKQTARHKPVKFRRGSLVVGIAVCVIAIVASANAGLHYLDAHTVGQVGDGMCDFCGGPLDRFLTYVLVLRDGEPFHEYCEWHGTAYYVVHPAMAWKYTLESVPVDAKEKGVGAGVAENSAAINALIAWWLIGCAALGVVALALPRARVLDL